MAGLDPTLVSRFWSKVDKSGECWLWTGTRSTGYGSISFEGVTYRAHRLAWEIANGPIPEGLFACHHCDNPPCVRQDHLFLGTAKDNAADAVRKRRHAKLRLTHCPKGHAYDAINTRIELSGARKCKPCHNAQKYERDAAMPRCLFWWERWTPGRMHPHTRGRCKRTTTHASGLCWGHRQEPKV